MTIEEIRRDSQRLSVLREEIIVMGMKYLGEMSDAVRRDLRDNLKLVSIIDYKIRETAASLALEDNKS